MSQRRVNCSFPMDPIPNIPAETFGLLGELDQDQLVVKPQHDLPIVFTSDVVINNFLHLPPSPLNSHPAIYSAPLQLPESQHSFSSQYFLKASLFHTSKEPFLYLPLQDHNCYHKNTGISPGKKHIEVVTNKEPNGLASSLYNTIVNIALLAI